MNENSLAAGRVESGRRNVTKLTQVARHASFAELPVMDMEQSLSGWMAVRNKKKSPRS